MNCSFKASTHQKQLLGLQPIPIEQKLYCIIIEFKHPRTVPTEDEGSVREIIRTAIKSALSTEELAVASAESNSSLLSLSLSIPTTMASSPTQTTAIGSNNNGTPSSSFSSNSQTAAASALKERIDRLVKAFFNTDNVSVTLITKDREDSIPSTPSCLSSTSKSQLSRKSSTCPATPDRRSTPDGRSNRFSNSPNGQLGILLSS